MNARRLLLAAGICSFALAVAVLIGLASLSIRRGLVVFVGAIAVLLAINELARRRGARSLARTPDPERRNRVPVPGRDLIGTVDQFRTETYGFTVSSRRIVEGLRGAAIAVLTRFEGLSDPQARARIEDGSWTDDPQAAAFLSPELDPPRSSIRDRLAAALDRDTAFRAGVRRTAAAVARIGYEGLGGRSIPDSLPSYDVDDDDVTPRTTSHPVEGVEVRGPSRTGHWTGVGALALAAIGVGAITESPAVVMTGVVGVGYAGFARSMDAPSPSLSIDRTLDEDAPDPGDEVSVATTITNESGRFLSDLRFVDGVPAGLAVVEGTTRLGTALRPGESVTLEYVVTARRGRHEFDPALVLTRDLSRSSERESYVQCETAIVAEPSMRPLAASVPLRATAASFAGRLTTGDAGSGTQFHSVREYRKSDPLNRIDWNRHARTGELATLEFHEERAARVLVLVDARKAAYVATEPDGAHAVDRSVDAAGRIAATLLEEGDTVGLAALGPIERPGESRSKDVDACWLAPASGLHHRMHLEQLLATHPQFSTLPPRTEGRWLSQQRMIRRRLGAETQVVLLTPLCDRHSMDIARRLDSRGHAVTVVSPDPTAERTTSQQLARVGRRIRRFDLQRAGIPVVDWPDDLSLDEAFARTNAGDRR